MLFIYLLNNFDKKSTIKVLEALRKKSNSQMWFSMIEYAEIEKFHVEVLPFLFSVNHNETFFDGSVKLG